MTRVTLAAGLALLVAVLVGATAAAHYPGAWWSKDELFAIETGYTTFTTSDTIRTRTREIDWTTTNAANMRHLAGHGYRFTLNNVDENDNLSATGRYSTNLPAPYYDRDFEGFFKCIEAEVTSESSSFPVAGTKIARR
jgi:hypothetical protein